MYIIEDEYHAEQSNPYPTYGAAVAELRRLAGIPWDKEPNQCPCTSWKTCSRLYRIIKFDDSNPESTKEISRVDFLEVSKTGSKWLRDPESVSM